MGDPIRAWGGCSAGIEALATSVERIGLSAYHTALDLNYRHELYARPVSTAAGQIRTYELAASHRADTLLRALDASAGPGDVVYDIGAYAGEYALALTAQRPGRAVVAFEPNPIQRERFRLNRAATDPAGDARLEPVGLGDETTTRSFYRSSFPKLSSFERADATRWGGRVVETHAVPIRRLDSFGELPPPDHIKVDVEGYGPEVLRGGRQTIERHQPLLYLEAHDRDGTNRAEQMQTFCADLSYTVVERDGVYICVPSNCDRAAVPFVP